VDYARLSSYPFRKESQEWIREQGVSLGEVLTNPVYERVVGEGLGRVLRSMEEGGIGETAAYDEAGALVAVLSYPVARMLVSAVGDLLLIRRHALREAEAAHEHMLKEDPAFLLELGQEELDLPAELGEDGQTFVVHFTDYLKAADALRGKPWRLFNQDMRAGRVRLERSKYARLLQEALRRRIESELPLDVNEEILEALEGPIQDVVAGVERLRASIQHESYGEFSPEYLPPCIRDLLEKMQHGINVPHVGRFALTAFLSAVGLDSDDVIDLFRVSPDFKEDVASYQVHHILGDTSGTKYSPPSCSTMNTYGICLRAKECEGLGHPLRYYYLKQRQTAREAGKEPVSGEGEGMGEGKDKGDVEGDAKGDLKGDVKEEVQAAGTEPDGKGRGRGTGKGKGTGMGKGKGKGKGGTKETRAESGEGEVTPGGG
jgi:DNA primase large subunit